MEGRRRGSCAVGRCSGRWVAAAGERSAEEGVVDSRNHLAAVEECSGSRRTGVAVEEGHSFRTEAEVVGWSSRRSLAEGDCPSQSQFKVHV